jgi:hypothetical protein
LVTSMIRCTAGSDGFAMVSNSVMVVLPAAVISDAIPGV